jgi:alkaline phosphatase
MMALLIKDGGSDSKINVGALTIENRFGRHLSRVTGAIPADSGRKRTGRPVSTHAAAAATAVPGGAKTCQPASMHGFVGFAIRGTAVASPAQAVVRP